MTQGYTPEVVEALGVFSLASVKVLRELMPDVSDEVLLLRLQLSAEVLLAESPLRSPKVQSLVRDLFQQLH